MAGFTEIMNIVSQVGGVTALALVAKGLLSYVLEPKAERVKGRRAQRAEDVDALSRLLQLTPGEVVRLQEQLVQSDTRMRALKADLATAHEEIAALRGQLSQVSMQLSNALMTIQQLQNGTKDDSR